VEGRMKAVQIML